MMRIAVAVVMVAGMWIGVEAWGQKPPLMAEKDVAALANEISGEAAKSNLEGIARFHRQRGSKGFHEAAELVAERLRAYGLSDVAILQFPADGKIFYGTQRSRPAWDAEFGKVAEMTSDMDACNKVVRDFEKQEKHEPEKPHGFNCISGLYDGVTIADYDTQPVVLAEDSESADVKAELVDVGEGTKESSYAGKDVEGKIVLVSAQPGAVQDLAVGKFGAVGIVSYAQNQKTAWSGENLDAIRWGHLVTFSANKTFAFMVSLRTAHAWQARLEKGDKILLHAVVRAGQHVGNYEVVTGTIPGADIKLKEEEIVFSCHLDHQRPGANDNASGCAAILEVARALQKLINDKKLERPARTIRFVFPPEIEGTMALLTHTGAEESSLASSAKKRDSQAKLTMTPELSNQLDANTAIYFLSGAALTRRIKAVVHMDMVGGGPETKAVFHVTRGPMSLPSFVHDVAWALAEWVNEESYQFAATGKAEYPLATAEGGREPLRAEYSTYSMGSDHDVYQDSSFGIPAIYLNDWPDRYIHTDFDTAANIDPTKLKRAAFIGGAGGYFLADFRIEAVPPADQAIVKGRLHRTEPLIERAANELPRDQFVTQINSERYEHGILDSVNKFAPGLGDELATDWAKLLDGLSAHGSRDKARGDGKLIHRRRAEPKGPLVVFGYDYFEAEWMRRGHTTQPKLLEYTGLRGGGEEYAYEVLNFADGNRNAQEIRDAVSAEYGPVPLELVVEYLKALEEIGVVEPVE